MNYDIVLILIMLAFAAYMTIIVCRHYRTGCDMKRQSAFIENHPFVEEDACGRSTSLAVRDACGRSTSLAVRDNGKIVKKYLQRFYDYKLKFNPTQVERYQLMHGTVWHALVNGRWLPLTYRRWGRYTIISLDNWERDRMYWQDPFFIMYLYGFTPEKIIPLRNNLPQHKNETNQN